MSPDKLGRYELIRVLGKGAMGLVYEGRDPNLDRRVAIKTIRVESLSDEAAAEYEKRFRIEARSAARLQHPNIVSVYDSDRDRDTAYLVMEFVPGDDLKNHLDSGKAYTLEQTLGIMDGLLSALDYAHRHNVVHRDIKPANLLIEASGRVKLTDFGVARIQDSGDATRTQGTMVGTLKYMSPEQVKGLPIDSRSDLFAAGIVLHQLLTGKRPFDGESDFAIIRQIVDNNPAAPSYFNPQLPPALDAVVARALAKSREQRFATAAEFAGALHAACQQAEDPTVAPPPGSVRRRRTDAMRAGGEGSTGTYAGTNSNVGSNIGSNFGSNFGSSSGGSSVTQELELVYWKDVKDSQDAEDIELFLAKFPSGVYADLARRRLKKLAGLATDASDLGLRTVPLTPSAVVSDKTLVQQRPADSGQHHPTSPGFAPASSVSNHAARLPEPTIMGRSRQPAAPASRAAVDAKAPSARTGAADNLADRAAAITEQKARATGSSRSRKSTSTSSTGNSRKPLPKAAIGAVLAGLAILALALIFVPESTPPQPAAVFAPTPAAAAAAAAAAAVVPAVTPAPAPAALPASPVVADATAKPGQPAASAPVASPLPLPPPVFAASAAAAAARVAEVLAAKKAAIDKERQARQAALDASKTATPATTPAQPAATTAAPATEHTAASPSRPPATSSAPANPRQACEDRVLIGFQICMTEQCAKPAYTHHPVCVQRRAMDQQRKESEQLRR